MTAMQMFDGDRTRPGDERGFLHKSKFGKFVTGAVGSVVSAVPVVGTVAKAIGVAQQVRKSVFRGGRDTRTAFTVPQLPSVVPQTFISTVKPSTFPGQFGGGDSTGVPVSNGPCQPPLIRSPMGNCISPKSPRGAELFAAQVIAGQYGAGFIAGSKLVDVAQCPRGTVLGKDMICYANLANKNRLYPRGRRPLLTGGDMRAISRARTAGNRLANAKSDLIAIGMLKAAGPRKRKRKAPTVC